MKPRHFTRTDETYEPSPANEITINRADPGDANVVLSLPGQPAAVALDPATAYKFGIAVLVAAAEIQGKRETNEA